MIDSMSDDELSTTDVLSDPSRDLCNLLKNTDDDDNANDVNVDKTVLQENIYYTETDFTDLLETGNYSHKDNLTILSLNIANIFSKLNSLKIFLNNLKSNKPDIIVVVETHISHSNSSGQNRETLKDLIHGYTFFHEGRLVKRGGGVGIFISNNIKTEPRVCDTQAKGVTFVEEKFENVVVRIPGCIKGNRNQVKDLIVMAIYRQPDSGNIDNFLSHLELRTLDKPKNELIFAGDINLDLLKYETHPPTAKYLDIMTNHRLIPKIVRPTRIKNRSATLIDHIFTRQTSMTLLSGILDMELSGNCGYTDHKPTFTIIKAEPPRNLPKRSFQISYFSKAGHSKRREGLMTHDWEGTLSETNPEIIYDQITSTYSHHYHSNISKKTVSGNSRRYKREPWMTDEILADIRRRDRLVKNKSKRTEYKKLRNEIVSKIRKAERTYLSKQVQESIGDIKKHWNILKGIINKTNNKEEVTTDFLYEGKWIKDKTENANSMNKYLANIGKETNETVGPSKQSSNHYLLKHSERNIHSLLLSRVDAEDVTDVCRKMTPKTSTDPLGLKQNTILDDIGIFAHVLAHMVNRSMESGICPSNSKLARVIPVYKEKGSKHSYGNYRPISLLTTFSKIMERLIHNKLFDFLVRYGIIFESQFGFRRGHNVCHATLDFVKAIEDALDKGEFAVGVFCDLSKAFDTLNHDILLTKLDHYGIRGKALEWMRSYLIGREQYVELNGSISGTLPICTGVPQGSILGPLLFIIYINDLPSATNLKTVIFADDSNLIIRSKDLSSLINNLNKELENVNDFFKANKLKLNTSKTKLVCFRKKSCNIDYGSMRVYLDGNKLEFEEEATFLGIRLDSHLKWEKHCNLVANKISRNNGIINRVKKLLPPPSLKILYSSLILPHLQYGLAAWGGCSGQNKKRVTNIQKRAIRTISKSYVTSHTEPRMKDLKILKLDDLYKQQCAGLIHDIVNKRAPSRMNGLVSFVKKPEIQSLRSHSSNPLQAREPLGRCKISSNSFCIKGPIIWNSLPLELQEIREKHIFKNRLKNYLLKPYSNVIVCNNPRCTDRRHHH